MLAGRVSHVDAAPIDRWVLAFNIILATATGVLSSMASLTQIRSKGFVGVTHQGGRSITGRTRLHQGLLATEVAAVVVLVSTTALLCQTLWNLYHSKRGFDADRVVIAGVMPGMSGTIPELQTRTLTFFDRVVDQIGRLPGVESVAAASTVPLSGPTIGLTGVSITGRPLERGKGGSVSVAVVTPGYFTTMRNTVLAGRDFSPQDRSDRERVAVVNEAFVRALASAMPLVGTPIRAGRSQLTVIGIVEDTPDTSLRQPARPFIYVPLAQTIGGSFVFGRLTLLVRARAGDPAALIPSVRAGVWALGHEIVIDEATTMDERLAAAVRAERNSALLFALLAGIALFVAVAGVYGVVAYSVAQKTREIGIRIALGARRRQVVGHIVRQLVWPLTLGIATGLAAAVGATHAVASVLFEIEPTDGLTYAATVLVVGSTALVAAWIPARHAARIDPVTALRAE